MRTTLGILLLAASLGACLDPHRVEASWSVDGNVISAMPQGQSNPLAISDGAGGAIIVWRDTRDGAADVYAQRVDANGVTLWTAGGVPVSQAFDTQEPSGLVPDGSGGAIIAWRDGRGPGDPWNIYAQRINASGSALWTTDGVLVCGAPQDQEAPVMVSDGSGGAILAWSDYRSAPRSIYAQRLNGAGVAQWAANGVQVRSQTSFINGLRLCSDDLGGAVACWSDARNNSTTVFAQRISPAGAMLWTVDGLPICTTPSPQHFPTACPTGAGGAIVAWMDFRNGVDNDLYVQSVSAAGALNWAAAGVAVCVQAQSQVQPIATADGAGGAFVVWLDQRLTPDYGIYAQRINSAGAVQWTANGVAEYTAPGWRQLNAVVPDGVGGILAIWDDQRDGANSLDVYAGRISGTGLPLWPAGGSALCARPDDQYGSCAASDGAQGIIAAWHDTRDPGSILDVYAQHLPREGGPHCEVGPGVCCSASPAFEDPVYTAGFPGAIAVATRDPDDTSQAVVVIYDLTANIPCENVNWAPLNRYSGVSDAWNVTALGTVFGLTLDAYGNIYVAHSSAYVHDRIGTVTNAGPGVVYRIDGVSGAMSVFATLPNYSDPSFTDVDESYPGLGNITYDCDHEQFFVTNLEDGRIYCLLGSGNSDQNLTCTVSTSVFDPGVADAGPTDPTLTTTTPGFASLGERLYAVQWHAGRVYYSNWSDNPFAGTFGQPASTGPNSIWSVALDGSGVIDPATVRLELFLPKLPFKTYSSPVADISFSPEGRMMLGERTMTSPSFVSAHLSRMLEYECQAGQWVPAGTFITGVFDQSAGGGVDYDFAPYDGAVCGGSAGRVWGTVEESMLTTSAMTSGPDGFRPTGGGPSTCLHIDLDGVVNAVDKQSVGDVEIACPPGSNVGVESTPIAPSDRLRVEPNPFRAGSGVTFTISGERALTIGIFDVRGRRVRRLVDPGTSASARRLSWDGRREDGSLAPAGMYVIRVELPNGVVVGKVVRID